MVLSKPALTGPEERHEAVENYAPGMPREGGGGGGGGCCLVIQLQISQASCMSLSWLTEL